MAIAKLEYRTYCKLTKRHTYLILTHELWGVYCEYMAGNNSLIMALHSLNQALSSRHFVLMLYVWVMAPMRDIVKSNIVICQNMIHWWVSANTLELRLSYTNPSTRAGQYHMLLYSRVLSYDISNNMAIANIGYSIHHTPLPLGWSMGCILRTFSLWLNHTVPIPVFWTILWWCCILIEWFHQWRILYIHIYDLQNREHMIH